MNNPYLEKVAALGDKDYQMAMSTANEIRTARGKKALDASDSKYKEMFKKHRGVSGRVAGTAVGSVVAPIVGSVAGYYLGKSHDNSAARDSFSEIVKNMD